MRNSINFKTRVVKPIIFIANNASYAKKIQVVLANAYEPFRGVYTKEAFEATVLTEEIIWQRIESKEVTIYCAEVSGEIAGTASTNVQNTNELFIFSMAVSPKYAGKGIGTLLIMAIEKEAMKNNCESIVLETYSQLKSAINLYERFCFKKTGKTRNYYGIEIFEMKKKTIS